MGTINEFWDLLNTRLKEIDLDDLKEFKGVLWEDLKSFLEASKNKIIEFSEALVAGEIDEEDYFNLLEGEKALMKMHALTTKGIAKAKIEKLRDMVIDTIINTAKETIL